MSRKDKNVVYKILVFSFADPKKAKTVSDELRAAASDQGYKIAAYSVVEVDAKGKAHIHESGHGLEGAVGGAAFGGVLGLIGGPAGLLAWVVAGAVVGGFFGKVGGRAIPDDEQERLAAQMQPNTSALMVLVEDEDVEAIMNRTAPYNAQVVTLTVGDEISGEIAQGVAADVEVPAPAAADKDAKE